MSHTRDETGAPAADRMVTRAELAQLLGGVSSETIRRHLKAKKIPPPDVRLSRQTAAGVGVL